MKTIVLIKKNGTSFNLFDKTVPRTVESARQDIDLMGKDVVTMTVKSAEPIVFDIGDRTVIIGKEYTLNLPPRERKAGDRLFYYDLTFEGLPYDLMRAAYSVNVDTTTNEIQDISGDSLTGDLNLFLTVLCANANRVFGVGKWIIGDIPSSTEVRTITFNEGDNCLSVLQRLCSESEYNMEFSITTLLNGNRAINVGSVGDIFPYLFEYGKNKGLYDLVRERLDSTNIVTRLNVYGGTRNIITDKYKMPDGSFRGLRLCLAGKKKGNSYIEDAAAIAKYGLWESTKIFDDIYPRRTTGEVTSIGANPFAFVDSTMDFDLNAKEPDGVTTKYLIVGMTAKISFTSGNLAGYEFELHSYDHSTKTFTIIQQQDQNGYKFPSETSAAFQFSIGDKYVITDIFYPETYITSAEVELADAAQQHLDTYKNPQVKYSLSVEAMFLKALVGSESSENIFNVGDYIQVSDTDLNVGVTLRVKSFSRDLINEYNYTLSIADRPVTVSVITDIVNQTTGSTTVIKNNRLNDPARGRRNWMAAQELMNKVFDPEGFYYTESIKPLSIDTSMLSVGAKSMQFSLEGIIFQANYGGDVNEVIYSAGSLVHYAILDGSEHPRVWFIPSGGESLTTSAERYIYARCSRSGSGGTMVFSADKIIVDSDPSYYYFLVGMLSSEIDGARTMSLMYGFTTINGRFIKTGRIQSADGLTYFDLDAGEFQGNFKFTTGQTIEEYIEGQFSNLKVGGRNLLLGSSAPEMTANTTGSGTSVLMSDEADAYRRSTPSIGVAIAISGCSYVHIDGREHISSIYVRQNSGSPVMITLYQTGNVSVSTKTTQVPSGVWTQIATNKYLAVGSSTLVLVSSVTTIAVDYKKAKVEHGTIATDWTPAPEDIDAEIAAQKNYIDTVTAGLQDQVDGVVDSWFYPYTPTTANYPASEWITEQEKLRHTGDTFTNTQQYDPLDPQTHDAGKSWRWLAGSGGVYSWSLIADSDAVKALLEASKALEAADGKMRVFMAQPTTDQEYDIGDLWVNATYPDLYSNDLLRCVTAKDIGDPFSISHWGLATKYTDDTVALMAAALAKYGSGKMLYRDPTFLSGLNGIALYNANGGTAVTLSRQVRQTDNPTQSGYDIRITYQGGSLGASPGLGGFYFTSNQTRPGGIYTINIYAKVPVGYNLEPTYNAIGTGGTQTWLTSKAGTGLFQQYIVLVKCGISGTFGDGGYIYIDGPATPPVNWYVAYATMYDALDPENSATEYLRQALQGSTDINGGLLATNVLMMKNALNEITGGMSGLSSDNVGIWTGGTYDQAIASLANVLFRKDGSGQLAGGKIFWDLFGALNVGNFKIVDGAIVGYDVNGAERVRFSTESLPSISSMASNYVTGSSEFYGSTGFLAESQYDSEGGYWYTQIINGSNYLTIVRTVQIPYATQLKVTNPSVGITISHPQNVVSTDTFKSVTVKNSGGTTIGSAGVDTNISIPSAGTYTVTLYVEIGATLIDGGYSSVINFSVSSSYAMYLESVQKSMVGKDGLMAYFSSSEHIHFKQGEGIRIKGASDMPGVLAAGDVSVTGGINTYYGAKFVSSQKNTGTGSYRINHSIGHTDYSIQVTPRLSAKLPYVTTKAVDYCTILFTNYAGTAADSPFEFLLIGAN